MKNEKYRLFRNYMTNELKITRDDIKAWTKQAVMEVAEKVVGQINVHDMIERQKKSG